MLDQLEPDYPAMVAEIRGLIAMYGENAVNMKQSQFVEICEMLLTKVLYLPIFTDDDASTESPGNAVQTEAKGKKISKC